MNAPVENLASDQPSFSSFFEVQAHLRANWEEFKRNVRGRRHQQLLQAMRESSYSDMTQREIFDAAKEYGYPSMTNGSRISELIDMEAIVPSGQRLCKVTNRFVTTYALTGRAIARRKDGEALANHLVYIVLREGTPVRVASHPLTAGPTEAVIVFKVDRRLSAKHCDGTSAVPASITDFENDLISFDTAVGARKHKRRDDLRNQSELGLTGTDGAFGN